MYILVKRKLFNIRFQNIKLLILIYYFLTCVISTGFGCQLYYCYFFICIYNIHCFQIQRTTLSYYFNRLKFNWTVFFF